MTWHSKAPFLHLPTPLRPFSLATPERKPFNGQTRSLQGKQWKAARPYFLALPPPPIPKHGNGRGKGRQSTQEKRIDLQQWTRPFTTSFLESSGHKGSKSDKEGTQKTTGASEGHLWRGFPIFIFGGGSPSLF